VPHRIFFETLEPRQLMTITAPWGYWPTAIGQAKVVQNYPWLDGGGNNVVVIDKGIDYWHPALGGNRATNTKSPRIVNVYDYRDNDTNPFPSESEKIDPSAAHATAAAGIIAGIPYVPSNEGKRYQGLLQNSKIFNIRENRFDSQGSIKKALGWVAANAAKNHITSVYVIDFVGTPSTTPIYAPEAQSLWNQNVFLGTAVANDWINPLYPHQKIGLPATSPYIFAVGGFAKGGAMTTVTQRGAGMDLLGPASYISVPYYTPSTNSEVWVNGWGAGNCWGAAYVVGTSVLLQQIDPTIKPADVMRIMQDSGAWTPDPDASLTGIAGYKRLDIYAAVNLTYSRRDDAYDQGAGGNDDIAHAKGFPLNSTGSGTASNLKLLIHDHDYYTFTVPSAGSYTFKTGYTGPSASPQAQLLGADGALLKTFGTTGSTVTLGAGRYYLHVYDPSRSLIGTYSLSVNRNAALTASVSRSIAPTAQTFSTMKNAFFSTKDDSLFA
jgi:hypothetical protein